MKTITADVSEPAFEEQMHRRTSLWNHHPASVGVPIQSITAEDDILGEMLDDTRDPISKSSAVLKS